MTDTQVQENVEVTIEDTPVLVVTPPAVVKIKQLLAEKNIPDYALRVFVAGGGCSGLQYGMAFEGNVQEFDTTVEIDGVRMVIDPTSLLYVRGAVIDFVDSLMGGGFRIDNPNAVSTCGCGTSFRTKDHEASEGGGCGTCGH
ncbi:MAG: iron-sulfur cluster insertion protein ErpA [Anaerolineae bacterium]|nr:iron-sulfur cluster insertion protein ErpA [Anaerolineae bacterium]